MTLSQAIITGGQVGRRPPTLVIINRYKQLHWRVLCTWMNSQFVPVKLILLSSLFRDCVLWGACGCAIAFRSPLISRLWATWNGLNFAMIVVGGTAVDFRWWTRWLESCDSGWQVEVSDNNVKSMMVTSLIWSRRAVDAWSGIQLSMLRLMMNMCRSDWTANIACNASQWREKFTTRDGNQVSAQTYWVL